MIPLLSQICDAVTVIIRIQSQGVWVLIPSVGKGFRVNSRGIVHLGWVAGNV